MHKKFLLIIYGPICSGKTTVSKKLSDNTGNLVYTSYDKVKMFISDYSAQKYSETGMVERLLLALVRQAISDNFSILLEGDSSLIRDNGIYKKMADENNMNFVEINLDCSFEAVEQRYEERIREFKNRNIKVFTTTKEGLEKRYNEYQAEKKAELPTFDSTLKNPEEIVFEIEKMVGLK